MKELEVPVRIVVGSRASFVHWPLYHPLLMIVYVSHKHYEIRSQLKRDYPLNLSILIRGGQDNNYDALSNGE
jgi:hypothetical protein